jgi:RES domain-containing protein
LHSPTSAAAYGGKGAAIAGGRWNPKDTPAAYASPSRALAMLEILVHIDWTNAPDDYVMVGAVIPDDSIERIANIPPNWDGDTPITACEEIGKAFIDEQRNLALVVSKGEENVLINPAHPRFGEIVFDKREPFAFDPRLAPHGVIAPAAPKIPRV